MSHLEGGKMKVKRKEFGFNLEVEYTEGKERERRTDA